MTANSIREWLSRKPFEPFRIETSTGESFIVRDPRTVALLRSEVFIAKPKSDRRTYLPLLQVATVESLHDPGRRRGRARRRPKA